MKEVDAALERAYALREQADRPRVVPPAPHVSCAHACGAPAKSSDSPAQSRSGATRPSCNGRRSF